MPSPAAAAAMESILTEQYCQLAALVLIGCEYFVNFTREVDFFWKKRVTVASVIFLSNRYLSLLSQGSLIANPTSTKSCYFVVNAFIVTNTLLYFFWAAFSSLRTYALCVGHIRVPLAVLVFLLSSVPAVVNIVNYRWLVVAASAIGCLEGVIGTGKVEENLTIASRVCLIIADLVVLGITWRATYRTTRLARVAPDTRSEHTFAGTLLRDGTLYFLILATLNIMHLIFTMLGITSDSPQNTSDIAYFTDPITSVLVSRLILNLQQVEHHQAALQCSTMSSTGRGSIHFASRVMGSVGSTLPPLDDPSLGNEWLELAMQERGGKDTAQEHAVSKLTLY